MADAAIAPWHPVRLLGEGTLARVYAARHESSRADAEAAYAVKVLKPNWWEHPAVVDILRREAYVGSRVRHPSVVPVLHASLAAPPYYLVMPRLAGCTLAECAARPQPLTTAEALWIARQAAEGLAATYQACGMTHGDIKPSNLFLSPQGRVTLLDLGFARAAGEHAAATDRPTLCSLAYAAPEAITSALAADFRSDFYSLGVTLYEVLAGRLPCEAADPARFIETLRTSNPACIRQARPDLPRPVASLVDRLLAKEPLRRPQTHAELIDELVRLEIDCFASR